MKFNVPDMSCGHCAASIEKAVKTVDASANVACNLQDRLVDIDTSAGQEAISNALRKAGYEAHALVPWG
ncbi:MAG: heavy-metal-associated domain-containing protein [Roseibium sp.]